MTQRAYKLSVVTAIGSLIVIFFLVSQIPKDYFLCRERHSIRFRDLHPVLYPVFMVLKNILGIVLLLAGIAMLVLPGQGLLTILVGISLIDFPGKYALERKLISRPSVFKAINWLRTKAGKEPLARS